jgi:predicted nucleic acid-binding protein
VIGGRVLDASALLAFASGTSTYAAALVWTAVEEGLVLAVPSSAIAAAWGELAEKDHPVLEVLLRLPTTVVDDLYRTAAREVGTRGGDVVDAHAVHCATRRGWPLVTADAARYSGTVTAGLEIEQLP